MIPAMRLITASGVTSSSAPSPATDGWRGVASPASPAGRRGVEALAASPWLPLAAAEAALGVPPSLGLCGVDAALATAAAPPPAASGPAAAVPSAPAAPAEEVAGRCTEEEELAGRCLTEDPALGVLPAEPSPAEGAGVE
mmetsp:Transcript_59820/g.187802  ORF Transcript_59820/g.187802 Transcript_59820/m.187802 type:complete len:140 (-) Transcript_59820:81-500(-)